MEQFNKRLNRKVSSALVQEALKRGTTLQEVQKDTLFVRNLHAKIEEKMNNNRRYTKLKQKTEVETVVEIKVEAVEKTKPKIKPKPKAKPKPKPKPKAKPKFSEVKAEIELIKKKMFVENLGYKQIASILGQDEQKIKRIYLKIMCEMVA